MNKLFKKWHSQKKYVKFVDFLNTLTDEEIRRLQNDRTDNSTDTTNQYDNSVSSSTLRERNIGESVDNVTDV